MSIPFSYGCAKPEPVVPDTLFFTFNGNGCTISNQAEYKTEISLGDRDLVFNILPDNGHVLPRKIETEAKGVTYNPTDGLIKIAKVTENVNVTATAPNGYHLSFTGSHCGIDGYHLYEADFIEGEDDRDINLLVEPENDKYVLPTKVEGLQDGMSYNPETGMIHIDQI